MASARSKKRVWGSVQLNIRCLSEVLSHSSKTIYLSNVGGCEPLRAEICEVVLGRVDVSILSLIHHCLSSAGWAASHQWLVLRASLQPVLLLLRTTASCSGKHIRDLFCFVLFFKQISISRAYEMKLFYE